MSILDEIAGLQTEKIPPPPKILKLPPVGVSSAVPAAGVAGPDDGSLAPADPLPIANEIPATTNRHTEHAGGSGFQILAVYTPGDLGSGWAFAPTTTQAERREIIEDAEWWDRRDARALKAKAEAEADAETEAVCGNIPE